MNIYEQLKEYLPAKKLMKDEEDLTDIGWNQCKAQYDEILKKAGSHLSRNDIAMAIKNADLPFMKCIAKERVNEAYLDIADVVFESLSQSKIIKVEK